MEACQLISSPSDIVLDVKFRSNKTKERIRTVSQNSAHVFCNECHIMNPFYISDSENTLNVIVLPSNQGLMLAPMLGYFHGSAGVHQSTSLLDDG